MAKVNLKDATKCLVEEASGILEKATGIRKGADALFNALRQMDQEFSRQKDEEAQRRKQQEQLKAQSAHAKAFTMLDDDEKQMMEAAMQEQTEKPAAESAEAVPGSYLKIACAPNMENIFRTIAQADSGVIYNCSAGKDRTGVVTAVLLMHCRVRDEEIAEDYMITKECSQKRFEWIRQNFPEVDLNIAIPRPSYMTEFLRLFRARFRDTEHYFAWLGLSPEDRGRLKDKLLS